ncbi:MAG TPA: TetR/AcrR family transcriptional regulator, partial [Solirubrobacteraceae bacterium]|nr:TetR/AcrR family transcriptional regulator [Solirubrobacteraceae bacterium]
GYRDSTVGDICAEAGISARCFHEHFASKQEVVLTAVEAALDQVMGYCQECFLASGDWPDAVWNTFELCAEWATNEPAFARVTTVELLTIGPDARELLHSLMDAFALFLAPGHQLIDSPAPGQLDQTISERVFELLYSHNAHNYPPRLLELIPEVARTALTPFLGVRETERFIAERSRRDMVGDATRRGTS